MSRRKRLDRVPGVFVDGLRLVELHGGESMVGCRMFSLPGMTGHLHELAIQMGLKRGWFEDSADLPAYWLGEWAHGAALRRGALLASDDVVRETCAAWRAVGMAQRGVALREQEELACLSGRSFRTPVDRVNEALSEDEVRMAFDECRALLGAGWGSR